MQIKLVFVFLLFSMAVCAQIEQPEVARVLQTLCADNMQGRKPGTQASTNAATFIASEFEKAGLKTLPGTSNYLQQFNILSSTIVEASVLVDGVKQPSSDFLVLASQDTLSWDGAAVPRITINKGENFGQKLYALAQEKGDKVIIADTSNRRMLKRFISFGMKRVEGSGNVVVVLTAAPVEKLEVKAMSKITKIPYQNVVAMVPGKLEDEFVVFSGHFDHLGIGKPVDGDSIYNGANDDASGTTAVIELAKYFSTQKKPKRTLLFVAFTAEESGGYGSSYFSKALDPKKVVAMFNIEMIGTESKWGKNSAYITGYEKSDFGKILQSSLKNTPFSFYPDPYPTQNLFYRSDNATLARLGVPAHTISTSKMDSEKYYHTVKDEFSTINLENMTEIIKSIALSSKLIISGKSTPTRVTGE
jgi:Peptidase family M28